MRNLTMGLATCGLMLMASCSNNELFEDNQEVNNPNVINFSSTTMRATMNNLNNVKSGFPVYAVTTKGADGTTSEIAWKIEGQTYYFDGYSWKWIGVAPQWAALKMFPMNFYAYYPANKKGDSDAVYSPQIEEEKYTFKATITIGSTADKQEDYLAANTSGITRPMATVPLAFKHITTKVNLGVIAAAGTKSYVQQMNINNVKSTGTYNYVKAEDLDDVLKGWEKTEFATSSKPVYDYFGVTGVSTDTKVTKNFTGSEVAAPFYDESSTPQASAAHLMLIPQKETPVWAPAKYTGYAVATRYTTGDDNQTNNIENTPAGLTITPLKAYIGSVYRMTDADDKDLVGYANASNHPNYAKSASALANYTGPLFVKVGFPLTAKQENGTYPDLSWTMGKAYTYNIALGQFNTSGGYILDNRYYDDKGNPTVLTIDGKNPGDAVLGGEINFHVTVGEWDEQAASGIQ